MYVDRIGMGSSRVCTPEIAWAQQQLNRMGEHLAVDGVDGPRTRAAVERFQTTEGLPVTGVLDPQTCHALGEAHPVTPRAGESPNTAAAGVRMPSLESESAYQRYARANNQVESNHHEVYSRLRTVGGAPASFGSGQLLLSDHLTQLRALQRRDPEFAARIGSSTTEVAELHRATTRALSAYDAVVSNHFESLHLSAAAQVALRAFRTAEQPVRDAAITSVLTEELGISSSQLTQLGAALDLRALRSEYLALGGNRDAAFSAVTADPRSQRLVEMLGDASFRHYVTRGALAENRGGFAMAAARQELGEQRVDVLLRAMSPFTTESRTRSNFARAENALENVHDVTGAEREVLLAQVAREFHAAPGTAARAFFVAQEPRFASAADVRAELTRLSSSRHHGDTRPAERFATALRNV